MIIGNPKKIRIVVFNRLFHPFHKMLWQSDSLEVSLKTFKTSNRFFLASAIDDPKKISYYTKEKIRKFKTDNPDKKFLPFDAETRRRYGIMTKAGKLLKAMFPSLDGTKISDYVSIFFAEIDSGEKIEVWTDIKKAYHGDNYYQERGSLGHSCMKYRNCQDYMEFYEKANCKILVLLKNNKVKARALLWQNVHFANKNITTVFMDRIYTCNENDERVLKNHAIKEGWVYKYRQSYSDDTFMLNGDSFDDNVSVDLNEDYPFEEFYSFPYCDTLKYLQDDMTVSNRSNSNTIGELTSTGGGCSWYSRVYLENEGCYISDDEAVYCDYLETYIRREYALRLYNGGYMPEDHEQVVYFEGSYYMEDACTYMDYREELIPNSYVMYDEIVGDDYYRGDRIFSELHNSYICNQWSQDHVICGIISNDHETDYYLDIDTGESHSLPSHEGFTIVNGIRYNVDDICFRNGIIIELSELLITDI